MILFLCLVPILLIWRFVFQLLCLKWEVGFVNDLLSEYQCPASYMRGPLRSSRPVLS